MIVPVKACILQVLLLKRISLVVGNLAVWWIVSLDVGVLNRNLMTRIAVVAWILYCATLSRKGGLRLVKRIIAVLTLSLALLHLVLLLGKAIWWILTLDVGVLNRNLLTRIAVVAWILYFAILSRKGGLRLVKRIIAVLTLSLTLLHLVLLLGKAIWWILTLDVGVLNRNLLTRIAVVAWILYCAILSRKGGLRVVKLLIVVLTLSRVLLPLVLLPGLAICVGQTKRILLVVH